MKKPKPIVEVYRYGPFVVEVSMLHNHRDDRIWQAWFGKAGSTQRFWSTFSIHKGVWFGPMAYQVVANTVVADLELSSVNVMGLRQQPFPQAQQLEVYKQRLKAARRSFSDDEFEEILQALNHEYESVPEIGTPTASLHNAKRMIVENEIPDWVTLRAVDPTDLEVTATWVLDGEPLGMKFFGFKHGTQVNTTGTITFFRMIGYYMSEQEFRKVRFAVPSVGPKEWSPYKRLVTLERGKDYGIEDFQPGEHDL